MTLLGATLFSLGLTRRACTPGRGFACGRGFAGLRDPAAGFFAAFFTAFFTAGFFRAVLFFLGAAFRFFALEVFFFAVSAAVFFRAVVLLEAATRFLAAAFFFTVLFFFTAPRDFLRDTVFLAAFFRAAAIFL